MTAPTQFHKSSLSGDANYVEVAVASQEVTVRNLKSPDGDQLVIGRPVFRAFVNGLRTR
nr:DUF397 domain-containing protein [Umezawaea beigongshangensis]